MDVYMYKYKHDLNESSTRNGKKSREYIPGSSIFKHSSIFLTSAVSSPFQPTDIHPFHPEESHIRNLKGLLFRLRETAR